MANFVKGVGRLSTNRYDFEKHLDGTDFRHTADTIDVNPPTILGDTVQSSFEYLADFVDSFGAIGQGFIAVPDGYDTYYASDVPGTEPAPNENSPYDSTIPALNYALDSILNNPDDPAHHRIRSGGILLIKAGTYVMDDTVDVPAGTVIIGEGYGTKIINRTSTQKPLFKIKQDLNRTNDKAINSTEPFVYSKETVFYNFVIADNFVEPKFIGDLAYKTPKNTSESAPLVQVEAGASFICDKVKFIGRVTYTGSNPSSLTALAIGVNNTIPVSTGTSLKLKNCDIDGFSIALSFLTKSTSAGSGTLTTVAQDYLVLENNKIRAFGRLNSDTDPTNYANNSFIKTNICNIKIDNNYFNAFDGGYIGNLLYLKDYQTPIDANLIPTINLTGNSGIIVNTISDTPDAFDIIQPDGFEYKTFTYFIESNNNFYNVSKTSSLKGSNPTWSVTVGDGVKSFGDFNGKNAIKQAIDYLINHTSFFSAHIQAKMGQFDIEDGTGINIPANYNIIIEGISPKETQIVKQSGNDAIFTIQQDGKLTLKNIHLESPSDFDGIDGYGAFLDMENVILVGVSLRWVDGPTSFGGSNVDSNDYIMRLNNCKFFGSSDDYFLIRLEGGDGNTHDGFFFKDCTFLNDWVGAENSSILKVMLSTSFDPDTVLSNIYFEKCHFGLYSTILSSGNFAGNPGILDLDMNGTDPSDPGVTSSWNPVLTVKDIHFINCTATCPSEISALFHTIPVTNALDWGEAADTGFIQINELEIIGGSYIANAGSRDVNPFTIILPYFNNTILRIRDVDFGFSSNSNSSHGDFTSDTNPWTNPKSLGVDESAWMFLKARTVEVSNINFRNLNHKTDSGDLFADAEILNINGVESHYTTGGNGLGAPTYRYTFLGTGKVSGLNLNGATTATNTEWASTSLIVLRSEFFDIRLAAYDAGTLVLQDSFVKGFIYNTSSYTDKIVYLQPVGENPLQIVINNCDFRDFVNGVYYSGTSAASNIRVGELTVSNSRISTFATSSTGITVAAGTTGTLYFESLIFANNIISADISAITVYGNAWNSGGNVTITGNSLRAADSSGISTILLRDYGSSALDRIHGQVYGNDCGSGSITLRATSATSDGDFTIGQIPVRGCETGYAAVSTRNFTSTASIVHNTALLKLLP